MATLTDTGRIALAKKLKSVPLHLAWGSGLDSWDATPLPETVGITALTTEIARRTADTVEFAVPDPVGPIIVPYFNGGAVSHSFSVSIAPTKYLYVAVQFAMADAPTARIRELGLFVDTVLAGGLPEGQRYFLPSEVSDPGLLLAVERLRPKIVRQPTTKHLFEFVLTL